MIPPSFNSIPVTFHCLKSPDKSPSFTRQESTSSIPPRFDCLPTTSFSRASSVASYFSSTSFVNDIGQPLPPDYQVKPEDIVCGRGKSHCNRPGNRRLRELVEAQLPTYQQAKNKLDKTMVLHAIVEQVMESGARFVKQKDGAYQELSADQAREKVGHLMRSLKGPLKSQTSFRAEKNKKKESLQDNAATIDSEEQVVRRAEIGASPPCHTADTQETPDEETDELAIKLRRSIVFAPNVFEEIFSIGDDNQNKTDRSTDLTENLRASITFAPDYLKDLFQEDDDEESDDDGSTMDLQGRLRASVIFSADRLPVLPDSDLRSSSCSVEPLSVESNLRQSILFSAQKYILENLGDYNEEGDDDEIDNKMAV